MSYSEFQGRCSPHTCCKPWAVLRDNALTGNDDSNHEMRDNVVTSQESCEQQFAPNGTEQAPPEQPPLREANIDRMHVLHSKRLYWIGRRLQDILLSMIALLILWPIMLIVAAIIWIDSPGASPIFAQERVGRDGKHFMFLKFRTMIPNAESQLSELLAQNEMDGPVFKIKNDPRITRVGKFLRKTSIDELPQLFNILKGDMSIVGPRPALPREVEQYSEYELQRLYVTPGLTCFWQIQPNRNDLSFAEWMELDLKYVQERSFKTDWKIIFKTVGAVFGMNGE